MEEIQALKARANAAYAANALDEAVALYSRAIEASGSARAPDLLCVLYSNRAAARLKLRDSQGALVDAESALSVDPDSVKALFRSAAACRELGKPLEARQRLLRAAELEPANKEVASLLQQVEAQLAQGAIAAAAQGQGAGAQPDEQPALHVCGGAAPRGVCAELVPPGCIPAGMRRGHVLQPSQDDVNYNLLILLHGLGDRPGPFAQLAQQLALPQTASLALPGPAEVPETNGGRAWHTAFDDAWELIQPRPGDTRRTASLAATAQQLLQLLEALVGRAGWRARQLHLLGFSQGGTAALEAARLYKGRLGSVVAISACLLPEDPAMLEAGSTAAAASASSSSPAGGAAGGEDERTPVLLTHGERDAVVARADVLASLRVLQGAGCAAAMFPVPGKAHAMISGRAEAQALMQFWSQHLLARPADPGFMPVV